MKIYSNHRDRGVTVEARLNSTMDWAIVESAELLPSGWYLVDFGTEKFTLPSRMVRATYNETGADYEL